MNEAHKNQIAEMLMNDYDIRPSLAYLIVKVFVESAEKIIKEDTEIINSRRKTDFMEGV